VGQASRALPVWKVRREGHRSLRSSTLVDRGDRSRMDRRTDSRDRRDPPVRIRTVGERQPTGRCASAARSRRPVRFARRARTTEGEVRRPGTVVPRYRPHSGDRYWPTESGHTPRRSLEILCRRQPPLQEVSWEARVAWPCCLSLQRRVRGFPDASLRNGRRRETSTRRRFGTRPSRLTGRPCGSIPERAAPRDFHAPRPRPFLNRGPFAGTMPPDKARTRSSPRGKSV
jgi:hypothetical protein